MFVGWEGNVPGRNEDSIAVAAFAEINTTSTFDVREGLTSDLETQGRSKWAANVGCWVNGEDVVEELRSGGPPGGNDAISISMSTPSGTINPNSKKKKKTSMIA